MAPRAPSDDERDARTDHDEGGEGERPPQPLEGSGDHRDEPAQPPQRRERDDKRDFIVEAEEEMQRKGPSPWHGLDLDDFDDWA